MTPSITSFTDFGTPGRKEALTTHKNPGTAERAWKKILNIYHNRAFLDFDDRGGTRTRESWRCWQERNDTGDIIRDTDWDTPSPSIVVEKQTPAPSRARKLMLED